MALTFIQNNPLILAFVSIARSALVARWGKLLKALAFGSSPIGLEKERVCLSSSSVPKVKDVKVSASVLS